MDARQLRFVYEENLQVLPTFAVVLAQPGFWLRVLDTGVDWVKVVHGEHKMVVHKPLPSAGTEADTVRKFTELASQGHHALMVHAPSAKESDRVMALLEGYKMSYGQKYRHLVIEDLVE